ncbi:MAG: UxaA family hydrolase [Peptococcaceae bacterium]
MNNYSFWGYPRPDGSFGVRNHVAIISASDNSNFVARRIESLIKRTVSICPSFGRGEVGEDLAQHVRTLSGMGINPNVHSVIVTALEPVIASKVANEIAKSGKRVEVVTLDDDGGSIGATDKGVKLARQMVIEASCVEREKVSLDNLILGVECGGSDTTSGVISNPVTGLVSDKLVDAGGTVILSETVEWMGAEHFLAKRAVNEEVAEEIFNAVKWYEDYIKSIGIDLIGTNPSPDNRKGGLTTIEEKALGAIKKGGSRPVQGIYKYAVRPDKKGLVLMDAPPPGVENITGLAGAGCQLIIFSTGKGNAIGNPLVPTIKVTGNPRTIARIPDNIDVDLSDVFSKGMSLKDSGDLLFGEMISYANGKLTTAEVLGDFEIAVTRIGYTV